MSCGHGGDAPSPGGEGNSGAKIPGHDVAARASAATAGWNALLDEVLKRLRCPRGGARKCSATVCLNAIAECRRAAHLLHVSKT
jgi:hypothetical protein